MTLSWKRFPARACRCGAAVLACAVWPGSVAAQVYLGVALGGNSSGDVTVASRSNDRASICDEYVNPRALALPQCTTPNRGAGDGWLAPFDSGSGLSVEAELGFRFSPRFRVAGIYSRSETGFDQTVASTDATGADFDKISNELSIGQETLGSAVSDQLFLVAYRDWPNSSRWTPFAGVGAGVARMRFDFSWLWARSANPQDIATGAGQPNAGEIRRNLAGTASVGRRVLRDRIAGYVVVAGAERRLSDTLSVGFKAQWKRFGAFESDAYTGDLLRSHPPNLRLDGSEPVDTWSRTNDTSRFSALLTLRYDLR